MVNVIILKRVFTPTCHCLTEKGKLRSSCQGGEVSQEESMVLCKWFHVTAESKAKEKKNTINNERRSSCSIPREAYTKAFFLFVHANTS